MTHSLPKANYYYYVSFTYSMGKVYLALSDRDSGIL